MSEFNKHINNIHFKACILGINSNEQPMENNNQQSELYKEIVIEGSPKIITNAVLNEFIVSHIGQS